MLIDDIFASSNIDMPTSVFGFDGKQHAMREAVVFRVEESWRLTKERSAELFCDASKPVITLPSRLPFPDTVIHLQDALIWCIGAAVRRHYFIQSVLLARPGAMGSDNIRGVVGWWPAQPETRGFGMLVTATDIELIKPPMQTVINVRDGAVWQDLNEEDKAPMSMMGAVICRFLYFLSCKNIRAVNVQIDDRLQAARRRRGKLPLISYKILELAPISDRSFHGDPKGLWTTRIHLCRGHFSNYGNGNGLLFGKYAGRFWFESHVRGNKDDGIVIKDYLVKPGVGVTH